MTKVIALLRREVIEHRNGILLTPIVLMSLMLLLIVGSLALQIGQIGLGGGQMVHGAGDLLDMLAALEPQARAGRIVAFMAVLTLPAMAVLPVVVFFILLGALYEERRDRSFLFWKSLPVSDLEEVLAKLATGLLIAPAVFLLLGIAFQLAALLLVSLFGLLQGGTVSALWSFGTLLTHWIYLPFVLFVWALWAAPVFAWVLLGSAYAPRTPFMYVVVPPVVLAVLEELLFNSSRLLGWIGNHLAGVPLLSELTTSGRYARMPGADGVDAFLDRLASPDFSALGAGLGHFDLWLGLAIAAVLVWGAVWLRRYNL